MTILSDGWFTPKPLNPIAKGNFKSAKYPTNLRAGFPWEPSPP
jgi:hypothetical protein